MREIPLIFILSGDRFDTRFVAPFERNKFSECSALPWLIGIEFLKKSKRILQNPSESPPSIIMLRNSPSHSNKPSVSNTNLLDWKLIFSRNLKPKSQGV